MNIVPQFGLGTFRLTGDTVIESVKTALEVGYRAVDTAQIYGNKPKLVKPLNSVVSIVKIFFSPQKFGRKIFQQKN